MSMNEIAESMDIAYTSVYTHLTRAREAIGEKLKNQPPGAKSTKSNAVPLGALLFNLFSDNIVNFNVPDAGWISNVLAQYQLALYTESVAAAETSATSVAIASTGATGATGTATAAVITANGTARAMAITCASVIAAFAIGVGVWFAVSEPSGEPVVIETQIEASIIFTGGYDSGGDIVYINPTHAEPQAHSIGGEVTVINWWIVRQGSEDILYAGDGDTVDDTLIFLKENGYRGEYILYFRLECESGAIQRTGKNFYIRD
jgi:hypothetical protein